jgi:hypothetical protein
LRKVMVPFSPVLLAIALSICASAQDNRWRQANDKELKGLIPARATVEKERIETELRTASGVTDGNGKFIAGVVMITSGYAAEGKYSHLFITQVPITIAGIKLSAGEYVFGTKRTDNDTLEVSFYEAATGKAVGSVAAGKDTRRGPVYSFVISPSNGEKGSMKIGRFAFEYSILK